MDTREIIMAVSNGVPHTLSHAAYLDVLAEHMARAKRRAAREARYEARRTLNARKSGNGNRERLRRVLARSGGAL